METKIKSNNSLDMICIVVFYIGAFQISIYYTFFTICELAQLNVVNFKENPILKMFNALRGYYVVFRPSHIYYLRKYTIQYDSFEYLRKHEFFNSK